MQSFLPGGVDIFKKLVMRRNYFYCERELTFLHSVELYHGLIAWQRLSAGGGKSRELHRPLLRVAATVSKNENDVKKAKNCCILTENSSTSLK